MKCPKCGHEQVSTVECEACGIIFAKYRQRLETQPDIPALRSQRAEKKPLPYKAIAVVAAILLVILVLVFTGGEEAPPLKPSVVTEQKPAEVETTTAEDEARYRYYKKLTGANLDRTFLRFQPGIVEEYIDAFNYRWIMAYYCDYATEIKKDKSRFYEIMRATMDSELRDRNAFPTKYQYKGDIRVRLVAKDRGVIHIDRNINVRSYLQGSSMNGQAGCGDTQNMNTEHYIRFPSFRFPLEVDVPLTSLQRVNFQESTMELEADIKFRIEEVKYKISYDKQSFKVYHQAVIEEMALLTNENASRKDRIFMTLSESQLY